MMDTVEHMEEVGCWKREKVLGSGGFGYVVLWRNKETNETIALKQCRFGHDAIMTPKHRSRWKLEVDMMSRLDHPNVVKAISVPLELDVPATELPLLAMEYCSSGDLRKILNRPENCCGLKEKHVRLLVRHVSSAINYLHSMRIIHRDLKPENIVIQDMDGKVVYKLIDLGYAKELDQGSLCTSFVGTLQYLAPELFMTQKYSCTVDYWSFGLVTHEVITGQRPFLPDKTPAEWIPIVKQKHSSHIRAYMDSGNIVYSSEIAPSNSICNVLKKDLEEWLQLMLEWDPKRRGKRDKTTAFSLLEKSLNKKVVLVFCVELCKLLSFEVCEETSVQELQQYLETETDIPVCEQEILLPKGQCLSFQKEAYHCSSNLEEEELIVFLLNKHPQVTVPSVNIIIPALVERMMRNPRDTMKYPEQREAWTQAVYLSQQESLLFNRLVQSFKTNLMHLLSKTSCLHKTTVKMMGEMSKLLAKCSFFKRSLEQDLESYEERVKAVGATFKLMHESWRASLDNLKKIELLQEKISSLEASSTNISTKTIDLQRCPYARSRQNDPLEDIYHKVLDAYGHLRKRPKEQRHIPHDNTEMVRLMCLCLQHRETQIRDIFSYIRKVTQIKRETEDLNPQLEAILTEIAEWDKQVDMWQQKRQEEMWKLVESLACAPYLTTKRIQPSLRATSPLHSLPSGSSDHYHEPTLPACQQISNIHWTQTPAYLAANFHSITSLTNGSNGVSHYVQASNPPSYISQFNPVPRVSAPFVPPERFIQSELLVRAPSSQFSKYSSSQQPPRNGAGTPVFHNQIDSLPSSEQVTLSSLLKKSAEDIQRIKNENKMLVHSVQTTMEYMKNCQEDVDVTKRGGILPSTWKPPD